MYETKMRQCEFGEFCWVATVSRPGSCARLAKIASRFTFFRGSDVYRINDLARAVMGRKKATAPMYASAPHP